MNTSFFDRFDFFTGVPDSQLKALCDYLFDRFGISEKHIVAANEGNAVALAAGYYMATKKTPVVYLQNSGIGNIINPVTSLTCPEVYGIPTVYVVGWRGEPGVHDEPQHKLMGTVTEKLLNDVGIETFVINTETTDEEVEKILTKWGTRLADGKSVAFIIKKGALTNKNSTKYENESALKRETALEIIMEAAKKDIVVSTTGKTSREIFEIRERNGEPHSNDFLTVGSMGHCSSIALGVAISKPAKRVWCIDGDGAFLMHMGAAAVIGSVSPSNFVHIVINNYAHESVGGMPTVAKNIDLCKIAEACGYAVIKKADCDSSLHSKLAEINETTGPVFIEVCCAIGSRADLGRPTVTPQESKEAFMSYLA